MPLRNYHQTICDQADYDGGHAIENVGGEAHELTEAIAAIFREIDTRADANRNANQACNGENDYRTDECVGHSSAGFADRLGSLCEESPVERAHTPQHKIGE